jgi:hypothetical protein
MIPSNAAPALFVFPVSGHFCFPGLVILSGKSYCQVLAPLFECFGFDLQGCWQKVSGKIGRVLLRGHKRIEILSIKCILWNGY